MVNLLCQPNGLILHVKIDISCVHIIIQRVLQHLIFATTSYLAFIVHPKKMKVEGSSNNKK
jgi:hypothetical protein